MEKEKPVELKNCSIESDGTVTCKIEKDQFNEIQRKNIKPSKLVFEIQENGSMDCRSC